MSGKRHSFILRITGIESKETIILSLATRRYNTSYAWSVKDSQRKLPSVLGALISRSRGVKFIANRANDVPEVLGYILAEMLAQCPDSSRFIFSTSFKVDRSCDVCF